MSHHIYRTEAIVLSARPYKEANLLATFLTREMGVVRAVVISGRKESSRLRYGAQPLSQVELSLVRGKLLWRVTGVHVVEQWQTTLVRKSDREIMRRIGNLIEALVVEEDASVTLYTTFIEGMRAIVLESDAGIRSLRELYMVRYILGELGYMEKETTALFNLSSVVSKETIEAMMKEKATLVGKINHAIGASQLYRSH